VRGGNDDSDLDFRLLGFLSDRCGFECNFVSLPTPDLNRIEYRYGF
jgi:hypothetical protein